MVGQDNRVSSNGDAMAYEMEAPPAMDGKGISVMANPEAVNNVLYSDVGINVLLNRLKQSIASARDLSGFLAKRARLEDEHAKGLEKLNRSHLEAVRRPDARQGSFVQQMTNICRAHDRIAEHGTHFANSLHQMHIDIDDLTANMERGRKHWKQEGSANEKKVKDAELALEKAKSRYDSLADDYDKARTGGSTSGRVFTVKGPKSAERHEEDLLRKLQTADQEYAGKVQAAQQTRHENLNAARPQAVKALQELIRECDSGVTLQLQKFAAFNEKLLVSTGLEISPLKTADVDPARALSLRDMIQQVDNDRDFHTYVSGHAGSVPPPAPEIRYEKHPTLGPSLHAPPTTSTPIKRQSGPQTPQAAQGPIYSTPQVAPASPTVVASQPPILPTADALNSSGSLATIAATSTAASGPGGSTSNYRASPQQSQFQATPTNSTLASTKPFQAQRQSSPKTAANGVFGNPRGPATSLPPTKPVFGESLDTLFRRDDTAVPMVVYQCIQAVDLFGLDIEGIYRLNGNANHMNQLKAVFDNDSARVDFRNPESFYHDVNSVAGLLKQFFRELPDPLFTSEHYTGFIDAARIEDDTARRDAIHAVINGLPDPNYATLRAVVMHLYRVQEHSQNNRMSTHNLAICFAPTLMGQHTGPQISDAGLQARVIDTILKNTWQIFDED